MRRRPNLNSEVSPEDGASRLSMTYNCTATRVTENETFVGLLIRQLRISTLI